ncbi:beta-galactosidase [Pseudoalteromonas sp. S3431]|uniref:beta-galactosidase n=1 Tax=Pseudoalteromonas sp. S3431 TaxID=579537 RepID=UPI00049EFA3F|nr:beta-galactosidase [Pseudoalteromonas sp. S3431]KDC54219.1 agarase [Pseudoalteromonas sp. S3431]
MNKIIRCLSIFVYSTLVLSGEGVAREFDLQHDNKTILIDDFEHASNSYKLTNKNIKTTQVIKNKNKALELSFSTKHKFSGITLKPNKLWDLSVLGNSALFFDVSNVSDFPVMLSVNITGKDKQVQRRTIGLTTNEHATLYFELNSQTLNVDTGLRDTPGSFKTAARKMILRGAKLNVDFSQVESIAIYTETQINPTAVTVDNLRFETIPDAKPDFLTNIVDKFGQSTQVNYPLKVSSEQQLRAIANKELNDLSKVTPRADRSKFGGWKQGPKLKATGFFRTEKVNGKWALVDPEGYLFFSSGIANARMANTTTFTGVDYRDDAVRARDPDDVTPEDSKGLNSNLAKYQKSAYIAYPDRRAMFNWLPQYNDKLANHYSYKRSSHLGPIQHGEVFSFYQANLERRYAQQYPDSYIDKWREVTLKRMQDWGFTSFGNWTDASFYNNQQVPYFANGWIIGDFKRLSSGFDYWGAMPDPFDPEFVKRANITTQVIAQEVQNNPWCIGVFIDNEMSWGGEGSTTLRYGIVLDALSKTTGNSPTKSVFGDMLKQKYKTISQLNKAWNRNIKSWEVFNNTGVNYKKDSNFNNAMIADLSWLLTRFSDEYFKVVNHSLKSVLPDHLYMGARFTSWGTSPEARWSAKKYADVISYNYYREGLDPMTWDMLKELDMPTIIGEFHIGSGDTGQPNPGIIHAANQRDRADMYKTYMKTVIDNPYLIGAHWFQYIDSPITGRAYDGENYNVGFVTTTDIPYPELVEAAKQVHKSLYQQRYGDVEIK